MYIRVQRRPRSTVLALVESRRIDGAPRQRMVRYLGSVPIEPTAEHVARLWVRIREALSDPDLGDDAARSAWLAACEAVIPPPSPGEAIERHEGPIVRGDVVRWPGGEGRVFWVGRGRLGVRSGTETVWLDVSEVTGRARPGGE